MTAYGDTLYLLPLSIQSCRCKLGKSRSYSCFQGAIVDGTAKRRLTGARHVRMVDTDKKAVTRCSGRSGIVSRPRTRREQRDDEEDEDEDEQDEEDDDDGDVLIGLMSSCAARNSWV